MRETYLYRDVNEERSEIEW